MARYRSYMICTSPRSGSTLLCRLLAATGLAGKPGSHFHAPSVQRWLQSFDRPTEGYESDLDAVRAAFDAAITYGTDGTDIFGLRMQRPSFEFFMRQMTAVFPGYVRDSERIEAAFGPTLFIQLSRQNKLDQAISYVKATQTGLWHKAPDGTEIERLSEPREPFYDSAEITRQMHTFVGHDAEWSDWFDRQRIEPLNLTYDALSADPTATLARILQCLGLDSNAARKVTVPVAKLADNTNRIWAQRYLAEQDRARATTP
ncbi:MAG: Stf0 family sulfotransferase [Pseudomonadota bacterium]